MSKSKMPSNKHQPKQGILKRRVLPSKTRTAPKKPTASKKKSKRVVKLRNSEVLKMLPTLVKLSRIKLSKSRNEALKLRFKAIRATPMSFKKKKNYKIKTRLNPKKFHVNHLSNRHGIQYIKRVNNGPYPPKKTKSKLR